MNIPSRDYKITVKVLLRQNDMNISLERNAKPLQWKLRCSSALAKAELFLLVQNLTFYTVHYFTAYYYLCQTMEFKG